jgi:hypothetical protein
MILLSLPRRLFLFRWIAGPEEAKNPSGRKVLCLRVVDPFNKLVKLFTAFKAATPKK